MILYNFEIILHVHIISKIDINDVYIWLFKINILPINRLGQNVICIYLYNLFTTPWLHEGDANKDMT